MTVQVAADVADHEEVGQLARLGGLDLAAALTQLGLDVLQTEQPVDALLVGVAVDLRLLPLLRLGLGHAVLRDRETALQRALA